MQLCPEQLTEWFKIYMKLYATNIMSYKNLL